MNATKNEWNSYCVAELDALRPILLRHSYTLDALQPHLAGERYLMQAITTTSGRKLILLGTNQDALRVVIKATRDPHGIRELAHEQVCREVLKKIDFAGEVFHTPEVLERISEDGFVVIVTRFIEQNVSFMERPLKEQFSLALRAFKGQESAHATTFKHRRLIAHTFGMRDASSYLTLFDGFIKNSAEALPGEQLLLTRFREAKDILQSHESIIEQYTGFLTHTDFVPHNIRIQDDTIILLDHSSLTFGNKYEGWARFLNFMTLYNQPLEQGLVQYVKANRTEEESVSLRMMRIYRLGEIIWYYIRTLPASEGNLLVLNTARIHFWSDVLSHVLRDEAIPLARILSYRQERDRLRSAEEKLRQQGLH